MHSLHQRLLQATVLEGRPEKNAPARTALASQQPEESRTNTPEATMLPSVSFPRRLPLNVV